MRLNNYANVDNLFNTPAYYLSHKKGQSILSWIRKNLGKINYKQAQTLGDNHVYSFHFDKSEDLAWFMMTFGDELKFISDNSHVQKIFDAMNKISFDSREAEKRSQNNV